MAAVRLYWWSEIFIQKKQKENYGDLLGKYLVEKISGKKVTWVRAQNFNIRNLYSPLYVTIGSVLAHINKYCTVWGSGINHKDETIASARFLSVRGPLSRKRILELGYECPTVYGDPALLLPLYYKPKVVKKHTLGIIPHITDLEIAKKLYGHRNGVKIIDFNTNDIEETTSEILSCEQVLSSSLHGVIVAHAYQIPAVQVKLSDHIFGDGVKYHDYLLSVGLNTYLPEFMENEEDIDKAVTVINNHESSLPSQQVIHKLQKGLLAVCPFKTTIDE